PTSDNSTKIASNSWQAIGVKHEKNNQDREYHDKLQRKFNAVKDIIARNQTLLSQDNIITIIRGKFVGSCSYTKLIRFNLSNMKFSHSEQNYIAEHSVYFIGYGLLPAMKITILLMYNFDSPAAIKILQEKFCDLLNQTGVNSAVIMNIINFVSNLDNKKSNAIRN
ncbi:MAG: hypothetical protein KBD37_06605, partial [Burkholderiales bacterium]|nr:hypothetical protein [Burkholderiales bacterium]